MSALRAVESFNLLYPIIYYRESASAKPASKNVKQNCNSEYVGIFNNENSTLMPSVEGTTSLNYNEYTNSTTLQTDDSNQSMYECNRRVPASYYTLQKIDNVSTLQDPSSLFTERSEQSESRQSGEPSVPYPVFQLYDIDSAEAQQHRALFNKAHVGNYSEYDDASLRQQHFLIDKTPDMAIGNKFTASVPAPQNSESEYVAKILSYDKKKQYAGRGNISSEASDNLPDPEIIESCDPHTLLQYVHNVGQPVQTISGESIRGVDQILMKIPHKYVWN